MSNDEKPTGALAPPHPNPLGSGRSEDCTRSSVGSDIYDATPTQSQAPRSPRPVPATSTQPMEGLGNSLSRVAVSVSSTFRPFHHLAYKAGSESPFPQDMAAEVQKAARVLRAFTTDPARPLEPLPRPYPAEPRLGLHDDDHQPYGAHPEEAASRKNYTLLPIPPTVLAGAVGLVIFTSARIGLHASLSTGSGILIGRMPDGSWGPPSAISVHSIGAGFLAGADMSDAVCVVNTDDALEAFTRTKVTLGPELAVAAGPWGAGGGIGVVVEGCKGGHHNHHRHRHNDPPPSGPDTAETDEALGEKMTRREVKEQEKEERKTSASDAIRAALGRPVYSYVRSRGLYVGLQVDGTVVSERRQANAKFYGMAMPTKQILNGYVPPGRWIECMGELYGVLADVETRAPPKLPPRPATGAGGEQTTQQGAGLGEDQKEQTKTNSASEEEWEELPRYEDYGAERGGGDVKREDGN